MLHVLVRARALSARVLVFVHLLAARLLLCISFAPPFSLRSLSSPLSLSLARALVCLLSRNIRAGDRPGLSSLRSLRLVEHTVTSTARSSTDREEEGGEEEVWRRKWWWKKVYSKLAVN